METPRLLWDIGTAYDLFVSLQVLHNPAEYGVRSAWAVGVRARVPVPEREILEQSLRLIFVPMHWIYTLPQPKDGETALWSLGQVPPEERLSVLSVKPGEDARVTETWAEVHARGSWSEREVETLQAACRDEDETYSIPREDLVTSLEWHAHAAEYGERYLEALRTYRQVFFADEEKRIRPALESALARAQELAGELSLTDLLEELSQGVRLTELPAVTEVVVAPSYWSTPLMIYGPLSAERFMYLFGARPPDASLIGGQAVPDGLLRGLQALSDATRLRMLRYLSQEPLAPAELARRLRLRAPTVTHHLSTLRLAGLVQVSLDKDKKRYAARPEAVASVWRALQGFLQEKGEEQQEDLP